MAINNSNSQGPMTPAPSQKRKGSGFVSFDKAAEQNKQASQDIGNKIQSNIGQQVQSAQGQVQGASQGIQGQIGAEQQRIGSAGQVAEQLAQNPLEVDKAKYKDLTSGQAKQIGTQGLQNLQGTLGSSVQAVQQTSSSPQARQEALQQVAKRPVASQSIFGVQRNLDSMLLGRNVNTQDIANQTARQAFNLDRSIGATLKDTAKTQADLQKQAGLARDTIRGARTAGITSVEDAAKAQAEAYNKDTADFLNYLNNDFGTAMNADVAVKLGIDPGTIQKGRDPNTPDTLAAPSQNRQMMDRVLYMLQGQGIDPTTLDITDIGKTEALNMIKQGVTGPQTITAQDATTDAQRARLKALYGLEDELGGKDYLNQADVQESLGMDVSKLKEASAQSAANTAAAKQKYDAAVALLDKQLNAYKVDAGTIGQNNINQLAMLDSNFGKSIADIDKQIEDLSSPFARGSMTSDQIEPARRKVEELKKQRVDTINDFIGSGKLRKAALSTMEQAARSNFAQSGTIDQLGEMLYKTPDLGTNSGWARAMSEVRNAFAPYVNRKVTTLMGSGINPNLQGGNYAGPGLAAVRTSGGGLLSDLASIAPTVLAPIPGSPNRLILDELKKY